VVPELRNVGVNAFHFLMELAAARLSMTNRWTRLPEAVPEVPKDTQVRAAREWSPTAAAATSVQAERAG
jgi:hypothetical protein